MVLSLLVIFFSSLPASDTEYSGGWAGAFLRLGVSATNLGMGNAGAAMPNTGGSFYYNPALLPFSEGISLVTGYNYLSLDRKFNYLGFSLPLPPSAFVSVHWIHAGVDDIQGRTSSGIPDEKYSTGEDAVMLSFGNKLSEKLSIGLTVKYLRHSLLDIAGSGVGFDMGVFYKIFDNLAFGLQAKDLNSSYTWKTTSLFEEEGSNYVEKFPKVFRGGLMYEIKNFRIVADIINIDRKNYFHTGAEYTCQDIGSLRIGWDDNSFTFGGGLKYGFLWKTRTELDYAFVQEKFGEGSSHVFTWNFKR